MLESKICPCTKDNYRRFLQSCCELERGLFLWCEIMLFFNICTSIYLVYIGRFYFPLLELVCNSIGIIGCIKDGLTGAKFLRAYQICLVAASIGIAFYSLFFWMYLVDDEMWWEATFYSVCCVCSVSLLHWLMSSAESLAKVKQGEFRRSLPDTLESQVPAGMIDLRKKTVDELEPQIIFVQHAVGAFPHVTRESQQIAPDLPPLQMTSSNAVYAPVYAQQPQAASMSNEMISASSSTSIDGMNRIVLPVQ